MKIKIEDTTDGLKVIRKLYLVEKDGNGNDITGPFWMLIKFQTKGGRLGWRVDGNVIYPSRQTTWLYVPPFSWTCDVFEQGTEVKVIGTIGLGNEPKNAPDVPVLFSSKGRFPQSKSQIEELFKRSVVRQTVNISSNPTAGALKIKKIIDEKFRSGVSMAQIAVKLKTSPAVCTRLFKGLLASPQATISGV